MVKKKFNHIPVHPETFIEFRELKKDVRGSDDQFMMDLILCYKKWKEEQ